MRDLAVLTSRSSSGVIKVTYKLIKPEKLRKRLAQRYKYSPSRTLSHTEEQQAVVMRRSGYSVVVLNL